MKKRLLVQPEGWTCSLDDCTPGFFIFNERLCFKSRYGDCYCESGEYFWGGTTTPEARNELIVQPVFTEWVEDE